MIKSENKKFIKFVNNPTSSSSATSNSSGTSSSSSSSNIDNRSNIKSENNDSVCLFKFVIISYSLIPLMIEKLLPLNFNVVIADESHYLKNAKAARTINMLLLLRKSVRAILLSGTPALSRPLELFTQLNSLDPETWPCIKAFGRR
jgi:SWI/SNF-related matrix-associated actin-dependent regulator 1 of chromatin subfamily A